MLSAVRALTGHTDRLTQTDRRDQTHYHDAFVGGKMQRISDSNEFVNLSVCVRGCVQLELKVHAETVFKNKKQLYTASVAEPFVTCRLGNSHALHSHDPLT